MVFDEETPGIEGEVTASGSRADFCILKPFTFRKHLNYVGICFLKVLVCRRSIWHEQLYAGLDLNH